MFKSPTIKGEETRTRILDGALRLFRARGFDATTMRDVAAEAGLSLGAAYHYFPVKEAIVLAYYEHVQAEHRERLLAALAERAAAGVASSLRERLGLAMHLKLDILRDDRPLLGALFRFTGDPDHPLSFLGPSTRASRQDSVALFGEAVGNEPLPKDLRALAPVLLWALHMGLLLYFLYDRSPAQARTRRLTDGALDLAVRFIPLIKLPMLRTVRRRLIDLLREAELVSIDGADGPAASPTPDR